jgi:hypothetical protein
MTNLIMCQFPCHHLKSARGREALKAAASVCELELPAPVTQLNVVAVDTHVMRPPIEHEPIPRICMEHAAVVTDNGAGVGAPEDLTSPSHIAERMKWLGRTSGPIRSGWNRAGFLEASTTLAGQR